MKIITHRSIEALYNSAKQYNMEVFESAISLSFYLYDDGEKGKRKAIEFHQFLKP
jgi:hypothetical protein